MNILSIIFSIGTMNKKRAAYVYTHVEEAKAASNDVTSPVLIVWKSSRADLRT